MLMLTRRIGEKLIIEGNIEVKIVDINGGQVRIGTDAPKDIVVHREEVHEGIRAERAAKAEIVR